MKTLSVIVEISKRHWTVWIFNYCWKICKMCIKPLKSSLSFLNGYALVIINHLPLYLQQNTSHAIHTKSAINTKQNWTIAIPRYQDRRFEFPIRNSWNETVRRSTSRNEIREKKPNWHKSVNHLKRRGNSGRMTDCFRVDFIFRSNARRCSNRSEFRSRYRLRRSRCNASTCIGAVRHLQLDEIHRRTDAIRFFKK